MKPLKKWFFLFVLSLGFVPLAHALDPVTVFYQPTPFPMSWIIDASRAEGSIKDESVSIPHVMDGAAMGFYQYGGWNNDAPLDVNEWLTVGKYSTWGDTEITSRMYIKFGLDGLPTDVTDAALRLWSAPLELDGGPVPQLMTEFNVVSDGSNNEWSDMTMTWGNQPSVEYQSMDAPGVNEWYRKDITQVYGDWKARRRSNNGFRLDSASIYPWYGGQMFSSAWNYTDATLRPVIELTFTPTLVLKMPFDGLRWNVGTEIGGGGCNIIHGGHQNNAYFSIDFEWCALQSDGSLAYSSTSDIPIIAAGPGKVISVVDNITVDGIWADGYGNSVVVEDEATGIAMRYSHLKPGSVNPDLVEGTTMVSQGTFIGNMGSTGASTGVHLDFSLTKKGSDGKMKGDKDQDSLAKVLMEGQLLKSYQVDDCWDGEPSQKYYTSSNVKCGDLVPCL